MGEALKAKGFSDLSGLDISQGMLDIAREKGIYQSLQKADLLQELPLEQGTYDCAVSSAVSTYLGKRSVFPSKCTNHYFFSAKNILLVDTTFFREIASII